MPSICFISEYGSRNGGENSLLSVIPFLIEQGWDCHALVPSDSELMSAMQEKGVACAPFEFRDQRQTRKPLELLREELACAMQRTSVDIFYANTLSTARVMGPVTKSLGLKGVGHLRDIIKLNNTAINDLNQLDLLIAVSEATKRFHVDQSLDASRTVVVHNGADLKRFCPRDATGFLHRELDLEGKNARLLLSVGQIGLRKGLETTFSAFERIVTEQIDAHLVIVGKRHSNKLESIDYERDLRLRSENGVMRGRVHWLGRRDDVHLLMNECQILLHAARQEPLGRVILESIASGLVPICTDVGGTNEILSPERFSRLLVDVDDTDSMAERAVELLDDRNCLEGLSQAVREEAERSFDASQSARRINDLLSNLLA